MIQGRLLFWKYFAVAYAVLFVPFVVTFLWIAAQSGRDFSLMGLGLSLLWASLWPIAIALSFVAVWFLGAAAAFLGWKYLELIQFVSGVPFGSRCGRAIVRDNFFAHARPTSPYAWVHRKALATYPPMIDDNAHA